MWEMMAPVWREALQEVKDPEIPDLSIVELGMVNRVTEEAGEVQVEITPTFVGCPALDLIAGDVREKLTQVKGVSRVRVSFVMDPPWTSERITPEGREKLKNFGIAPPGPGGKTPWTSCLSVPSVVLGGRGTQSVRSHGLPVHLLLPKLSSAL